MQPAQAGQEDGKAYWNVIEKNAEWLMYSINRKEDVAFEVKLAAGYASSETDILESGALSFDDEEGERSETYRKAFEKSVDTERKAWLVKNVGTCPGTEEAGFMLDGRSHFMAEAVKGIMNNPDSYKFVKYKTMLFMKYKGQWAWQVDFCCRGQNSFGAIVTSNMTLYVNDEYRINTGKFLGIETQKDSE